METVERIKNTLLTLYPVRKTTGQKAMFREWLVKELKHDGYRVREERYGKTNGTVNVIAGDPDKATVFLMAHYDTPSKMLLPNFVSPTNVPAHLIYHFVAAFLLMVIALVLSFVITYPINQPKLTFPLFVILALALLFFTAFGPANRIKLCCFP